MAFTVPTIEPPQPLGLLAGDWIQASSMNSLVQRDRFVFATRRRLIASLLKVVTTASAAYQTAYAFQAKTLPTATDTILIGVTASDDCTVRVSILAVTSTTVTTGGPGCIIGSLTGVPISTWITLVVEVKSNTGSPVTIYGINIQEQILTATDLP